MKNFKYFFAFLPFFLLCSFDSECSAWRMENNSRNVWMPGSFVPDLRGCPKKAPLGPVQVRKTEKKPSRPVQCKFTPNIPTGGKRVMVPAGGCNGIVQIPRGKSFIIPLAVGKFGEIGSGGISFRKDRMPYLIHDLRPQQKIREGQTSIDNTKKFKVINGTGIVFKNTEIQKVSYDPKLREVTRRQAANRWSPYPSYFSEQMRNDVKMWGKGALSAGFFPNQ